MGGDQLHSGSRGAVALPVPRLRSCDIVPCAHIPVPQQPVQTSSLESVQTLGTAPARRPLCRDVTSCSGRRGCAANITTSSRVQSSVFFMRERFEGPAVVNYTYDAEQLVDGTSLSDEPAASLFREEYGSIRFARHTDTCPPKCNASTLR